MQKAEKPREKKSWLSLSREGEETCTFYPHSQGPVTDEANPGHWQCQAKQDTLTPPRGVSWCTTDTNKYQRLFYLNIVQVNPDIFLKIFLFILNHFNKPFVGRASHIIKPLLCIIGPFICLDQYSYLYLFINQEPDKLLQIKLLLIQ